MKNKANKDEAASATPCSSTSASGSRSLVGEVEVAGAADTADADADGGEEEDGNEAGDATYDDAGEEEEINVWIKKKEMITVSYSIFLFSVSRITDTAS